MSDRTGELGLGGEFRAEKFSRLDEGRGNPPAGEPDKFKAYKANVQAQNEYREAYAQLAMRDPAAALRLPHPDAHDTDHAAALEAIRNGGGATRVAADPRVDIRG